VTSQAALKITESAETQNASTISYALDIRDLSKRFKRRTVRAGYTTLKSSLLGLFRSQAKAERFTTAIDNLTLRIPAGASVGVIGRNGSGKSTFLKLITGIYQPDYGSVVVNGRVAALIELGAGFHPDFSGRENLYLGGVIHGLSRTELDQRFDEIVRFAELEQVIDDPVRTYSSGMYMRLGFSLAVHTDPDILLVDEVLAVGDAGFVAKCKERIAQMRREGKTLILVTHDLDAVERWCDEVLWLDHGQVMDRGNPRRVIDHYRQFLERGEENDLFNEQAQHNDLQLSNSAQLDVQEQSSRWGSREVEITGISLKSGHEEKLLFHAHDPVRIEIAYKVNEHVKDVVFGLGINRTDGLVVHGTNTEIERIGVKELGREGVIAFEIASLPLLDGNYTLDVAVHRQDGYPYDYHKGYLQFAVRSPIAQVGVISLRYRFEQ
jgi:ABC-type polysaccharide/polyol phosphate transport system ATPase subunit